MHTLLRGSAEIGRQEMTALQTARRLGMVTIACAALLTPGAAIAAAGTAVPSHKGILPPKNPKRSLSPRPFFLASSLCTHGKDGPGCNRLVLKATTRARRLLERMGAMSFSLSAYEKLKPIEQLFVTVNLERTARGLRPATVLTRSLDKVAQEGANADKDPNLRNVPDPLPGGGTLYGLGANWAG